MPVESHTARTDRKLAIQPLAPFVVDETGPGAQPLNTAKGDNTAQPTSIPAVIDNVTGNPMIMPKISVQSAESSRFIPRQCVLTLTNIRQGWGKPVSSVSPHSTIFRDATDHHIQPAARLVPKGIPRTSNTGMEKMIGKRKLRNYNEVSAPSMSWNERI